MSNLLYVAGAMALSAVGSFVVWIRHRKPKSMYSGIEEFNKELRALSPNRHSDRRV